MNSPRAHSRAVPPTKREPRRRSGSPPIAGSLHPANIIELQRAAGNRAAGLALQRANATTPAETSADTSVDTSVEAERPVREAIRDLARSITRRTGTSKLRVSAVKKALLKRMKSGPPFSTDETDQIRALAVRDTKWLTQVGIGDYREAAAYRGKRNFHDWLDLEPGKRLLVASLAWEQDRHGAGARNAAATPVDPAYTLGRNLALHGHENGGPALSEEERAPHENERDRRIHYAMVNTLDGPWPSLNSAVTDADRVKNDRAQEILTRVFLILQNGLREYNGESHVDFRDADLARALAHGGRVNIRIPALGNTKDSHSLSGQPRDPKAFELTDWLGLTDKGQDKDPAERRPYATHRMHITDNEGDQPGRFEEKGHLFPAGAQNALGHLLRVEDRPLYGVNLAADGLGNLDFNGEVITPNGAHGHMLLAFTPPRANRDGALQVGIETTAPGMRKEDSPVGYEHTWRSSAKTKNPESSLYGHKSDALGQGDLPVSKLTVDLGEFKTADGAGWRQYLTDLEQLWKDKRENVGKAPEARKEDDESYLRRELYARLVGPRSPEFRPGTASSTGRTVS